MSRAGKILIAHPNLPSTDPFYKSVVYVFEDGPDGTQGIILNKPSEFLVSDYFKSKGVHIPVQKETIRFGGPIKTNLIVMLHSDEWYSQSTAYHMSGVALSCDDFMLQKLAIQDYPKCFRMFVGLAGWAPGQLDAELSGKHPYTSENSWLIADADLNIIFEHDTQRQWEKAVQRSSQEMINSFF